MSLFKLGEDIIEVILLVRNWETKQIGTTTLSNIEKYKHESSLFLRFNMQREDLRC
jgi:hypothetical protein